MKKGRFRELSLAPFFYSSESVSTTSPKRHNILSEGSVLHPDVQSLLSGLRPEPRTDQDPTNRQHHASIIAPLCLERLRPIIDLFQNSGILTIHQSGKAMTNANLPV